VVKALVQRLGAAAVTVGLSGCAQFAAAPDAAVRDAAVEYLTRPSLSDGPPKSYVIARAGKIMPWRQQDADRQAALDVARQLHLLLEDRKHVACELVRLQLLKAPERQIQPFRSRNVRLQQETEHLRLVGDSLQHTRNTSRIGSAISLLYQSEVDTSTTYSSTLIVLNNGQVEPITLNNGQTARIVNCTLPGQFR
jgi:hypothetical protein